ncbi:Ogr/Delta-like Zn-finger protein [Rhodobacter phage RcZahn]|nr:Ogr/Delta-like Zn-finger protein [Rhodobacter phage RcZahn]
MAEYDALPCPVCGGKTHVMESRPSSDLGFATVWRRRKCLSCGHLHRTFEVHADLIEVADLKGLMEELRSGA